MIYKYIFSTKIPKRPLKNMYKIASSLRTRIEVLFEILAWLEITIWDSHSKICLGWKIHLVWQSHSLTKLELKILVVHLHLPNNCLPNCKLEIEIAIAYLLLLEVTFWDSHTWLKFIIGLTVLFIVQIGRESTCLPLVFTQ